MIKDREVRAFAPLEVRAAEGDGVKVAGYAAIFDEETQVGDYFIERVARGAFTETLKRRGKKGAAEDVIFVINHNETLLLARTRSGTLTLKEDERGLYMESVLDPIDPDAVRVVQKMKRGDLDRMSFAFKAVRQDWAHMEGELSRRTLVEVELFDVSVVTDPAYGGTEIGIRSAQDIRDANLPTQDISNRAALARMRMKNALFTRLS